MNDDKRKRLEAAGWKASMVEEFLEVDSSEIDLFAKAQKINPFCGWGAGPDVGINLERTPTQAAGWRDAHLHWFIDLTANEADELADKLRECARQARDLQRLAEAMDASVEDS